MTLEASAPNTFTDADAADLAARVRKERNEGVAAPPRDRLFLGADALIAQITREGKEIISDGVTRVPLTR